MPENANLSPFDDRFSSLRGALELREGRRESFSPSIDPKRVHVGVGELRLLLDVYDAAREAAEWHSGRGTKHITDVRLIAALTQPAELPEKPQGVAR